jgi:hypothetical protein
LFVFVLFWFFSNLLFFLKNAVITVPAYFNDAQRSATQDAGRIAGYFQFLGGKKSCFEF